MLTKVSIGYKRFSPCMSPWSAQHNRVHDFFLNLQEIFNEIVEEKSQIGFCILKVLQSARWRVRPSSKFNFTNDCAFYPQEHHIYHFFSKNLPSFWTFAKNYLYITNEIFWIRAHRSVFCHVVRSRNRNWRYIWQKTCNTLWNASRKMPSIKQKTTPRRS